MKILIPIHTVPGIKSITILELEPILSILKNKINIQIVWLVYSFEKLTSTIKIDSDDVILDIHNYKNALEVIQKEKPDLVYAYASWNFIDYALSSVAKLFKIPVFCIVNGDYNGYASTLEKNITSNLNRFFQNSIPTDNKKIKKKLMKRGRFFLYKYLFLLQTMLAIKKNRFKTLFSIWKYIFLDKLDPKFASETIQFLENENLNKQLLSLGFKKSNLIVTGNPMYDSLFFKLQKLQAKNTKKNTKNILLVTTSLYEHGIWTKKQRDFAIKETLKQFQNKKDLNIILKIHPSSEILSEYEQLLKEILPNAVIYQKGDIENFINDSDLVISFPASSVLIFTLLIKKPLIVCNYFNMDDLFLKHNPIAECNNPLSILKKIDELTSFNLKFNKDRDNFVDEFISPFDGHAQERICDYLIKITQNLNKKL